MNIADRGIPTKESPSGVTFAYIETRSGYLLKVRTKNQWRGVSGVFPTVPEDVNFIAKGLKVSLSFASWPDQEAEVAPPPVRKKQRKVRRREDNRRKNWQRSYHANRRSRA